MNNQEIIKLYQSGESLAACARACDSTAYKIKKILIENNIKIRSRHDQAVLENMKRGKLINHHYFDILNNENSYYLGFIAANGTVRKQRNAIKIGLSSVDKDFLEEMRQKLQSERKIKDYQTTNGFPISELTFSSLQIKEVLSKYSIVPNKTYIGITMKNIPYEYKLAFIKGFFDGDGRFSYNKNIRQGRVSFTSHKKEILEEIQDFFNLNGYICQDKRTLTYSLEYSTMPSIQILEQFYNLNTPCLKRKFNKFQEFIKLRNN